MPTMALFSPLGAEAMNIATNGLVVCFVLEFDNQVMEMLVPESIQDQLFHGLTLKVTAKLENRMGFSKLLVFFTMIILDTFPVLFVKLGKLTIPIHTCCAVRDMRV